ncbi:MAG: M23 family metallopeptidase [Candidatus Hodarchaeales archaeon]|jgi:murein DD-endopeptidase MepM/ murein hydrolase activator NlpD
MENKKTLELVQQLKLNVTNIHSFLIAENKKKKKLAADKDKQEKKKLNAERIRKKEQNLEKKEEKTKKTITKDDKSISGGSILDDLLNFGGLILGGILVNSLPAIIKKTKEIFDSIVNFLTPIQSGFNLIKAFFEGDIDKSKYDADKKRVDDALENINGKGGLIDQLAEKAGPLEGLIKTLKPAIELIRGAVGGKKMVLAKKGGKEGVLNKETGEFTERQFTAGEREKFEGKESGTRPDTVTEGKPDVPLEMKKGHYYFPLPNGQFSGESGQYYGAGRSYGGHAGIDLTESPPFGSKANIDVVAMVGGKVIGEKYLGGKKYMSGMMIQGTDGYDQRYLHMTPMVSPGDNVKAGQKIGELVDMTHVTGNIDETHLHFEVYKRGKGSHLSPHNVYPKFFGSPRSAPRSLDTREKAQGGRMFESIRDPKRLQSLNQPDPRKRNGSMTIAVQQVNTVQPVPYMVPFPVASKQPSSSPQSQLPAIWSA